MMEPENATRLNLLSTECQDAPRRAELAIALSQLLNMGKGVYLACRDQDEVRFYVQQLMPHAGPKLRTFVHSRD